MTSPVLKMRVKTRTIMSRICEVRLHLKIIYMQHIMGMTGVRCLNIEPNTVSRRGATLWIIQD